MFSQDPWQVQKDKLATLTWFFLQLHVCITVEILGSSAFCYRKTNFYSFDALPHSGGSGMLTLKMHSWHGYSAWRQIIINTMLKMWNLLCSQSWLKDIRIIQRRSVVLEDINSWVGHVLRSIGQLNKCICYFRIPDV